MQEAVISILLADSALSALVGTRINWLLRPQDIETLPAITLQTVSGVHDYDMDGPSGLVSSRLQVDAWAETYGAARGALEAATAALSGFSGTAAGTQVQGGFIDNERDFQEDATGGEHRLYRCSADLIIWHCS